MSHLSLHIVPREPKDDSKWAEYSVHQKALRLRSLQEDASAFISRYESEVKEPTSFWINRLKDPTAWTVIMIRGPGDLPDTDEVLLHKDVEWVAFCVMINTREPNENLLDREKVGEDVLMGDWYMAAVWLSPNLRGQGAGKRLVEFGIDLVRTQNAINGSKSGQIRTDVIHGNDHALELYKKLGFEVVDSNATSEKEGRKRGTTKVKLVL